MSRRLPERARSIRARLAIRYALVSLLSGAALLTFSYIVVRHEIGPGAFAQFATSSSSSAPSRAAAGVPATVIPPTTGVQRSTSSESSQAGVVSVAAVSSRDAEALRTVVLSFIGALVVMTLVSAALGWQLAGRALAPVSKITATARLVSERSRHERINLQGPQDELQELADTFDAMLDSIDAAFDAERQFVANASHELRTPLAVVRTALDVGREDGSITPAADRTLAIVDRTLEQAERLVAGLLVLARSEQEQPPTTPVRLDEIVEAAVAAVGDAAGRVRVNGAPCTVLGQPDLLLILAGNLIDNAIRHGAPGGRVDVSLRTVGAAAELTVANEGERLDPGGVEALLRPFERGARRTGTGSGIGLSIVNAITAAHQGTLTLTPPPTGGLRIGVRLPLAPGPLGPRRHVS